MAQAVNIDTKVPLKLGDITNITINEVEGAAVDSWEIEVYVKDAGASGWMLVGKVQDNSGIFTDGIVPKGPGATRIKIVQGTGNVGEIAKDNEYYLIVTHGGDPYNIFVPIGPPDGSIYYIDQFGLPYHDESLTQPAYSILQVNDDIDVEEGISDTPYFEIQDKISIRESLLRGVVRSVEDEIPLSDTIELGDYLEIIDKVGVGEMLFRGSYFEVEDRISLMEALSRGEYLEIIDTINLIDFIRKGNLWSKITPSTMSWRKI